MKDIEITFKCGSEWKYVDPIVPASHALPQWYKDMTPDIPGNHSISRSRDGTIKACPAMFDNMAQGYILPLWTDIYVEPSGEFIDGKSIPRFAWTKGIEITHPFLSVGSKQQTAGMPSADAIPSPWLRLESPWLISTPKGYSTLFIPPFGNADILFEPISGIVHTDIFSTYIKLLTLWKGPEDFQGVIKAGTPMVQMIPFKRESFQHNLTITTPEDEKEEKACTHAVGKLGFMASYRKFFNPTTKSQYK